jgi:hypothetical protein
MRTTWQDLFGASTMIQSTPEFEDFCKRQMAKDVLSYEEGMQIYEALHREALALGAISSENIWDGFDVDLRVAKAINGLPS